MKLIELVKDHSWPDGAAVCAQDIDGTVFWFESSAIKFGGGVWSQLTDSHDAVDFYDFGHLADDYSVEIVTYANWLTAQEQVEPKEREPGFYWVRILSSGEWVVCWWNGYCFDSTHDQEFGPSEVEVDERRIVRQP